MIRRLLLLFIAISTLLPGLYAQCDEMMQGGDNFFNKGQYGKALTMYYDVQAKCGNYAGVGKKIEKCQNALKEYNDYNKCNTIEGCEYYLSAHPNGKFVASVRSKLARLQEEMDPDYQAIEEESMYYLCFAESASESDMESACKDYLYRFPNGRYAAEVRERIRFFERNRKEEDAYKKCNTMSGCTYYLDMYPKGKYYNDVSAKKEELENNAAKNAYMRIEKIEFANGYLNGEIIDNYGAALYAPKMRFLMPRITYEGILDESRHVELMCKIMSSDGKLMTTSSSPKGYTYSCDFQVKSGSGNTFEMPGYGASQEGAFSAGNYKLELWYHDTCVRKATFTIEALDNDLLSGWLRDALRSVSPSSGSYKGQRSSASGQCNGFGLLASESGSYYIGNFYYGDFSGKGMYIVTRKGRCVPYCNDCNCYVGNWNSDKKSGTGRCYDRYGNMIYEGGFQYDKPVDTYPSSDTSEYKFECKKYFDDSYYIGETKNGKRNGMGMMVYNGDLWCGEWSEGSAVGKGVYMYSSGEVKAGTWKGDDK